MQKSVASYSNKPQFSKLDPLNSNQRPDATPSRSGPISTQGMNRQHNTSSQAPQRSSSVKAEATSKPNLNELGKPKIAKPIPGTDWVFVTTELNNNFYFNRKTQESSLELPDSVRDFIQRSANLASAKSPSQQSQSSSHSTKPHQQHQQLYKKSSSTQTLKTSELHPTSLNELSSSALESANDVVNIERKMKTLKPQTKIKPTRDAMLSTRPSAKLEIADEKQVRSEMTDKREDIKYSDDSERLTSEYEQEITEENTNLDPEIFGPIGNRYSKRQVRELIKAKHLEDELSKQKINPKHIVVPLTDEQINVYLVDQGFDATNDDSVIDEGIPVIEAIEYTPLTDSQVEEARGSSSSSQQSSHSSNVRYLDETNKAILEFAANLFRQGKSLQVLNNVKKHMEAVDQKFLNGIALTFREEQVLLYDLFLQMQCYIHRGETEKAELVIKKAQTIRVDHPVAKMCEAVYLRSRAQDMEAMKIMSEVVDEEPLNPIFLYQYFEILADGEQYDRAYQVIEDLLRIDPNHYMGKVQLALMLAKVGDYSEATKELDAAYKLKPERPEAYTAQGRLYLEVNRINEALGCFEKALEVQPSWAPAYSAIGRGLLEKDMLEDAYNAFSAALQLDPLNLEALIGKSSTCSKLEKYEEMLESATTATRIHPGAVEAFWNKGRAELELKMANSAVATFEQCVELDEHHEDFWVYLGTALHTAGRTTECIARMDQLLILNPNSSKAHQNKGFAHVALGKLNEGLREFDLALQKDPHNSDAKLGRVSALMALGRSTEAQEYYETFKDDSLTSAVNEAKIFAQKARMSAEAGGYSTSREAVPEEEDEEKKAHKELGHLQKQLDETLKDVAADGGSAFLNMFNLGAMEPEDQAEEDMMKNGKGFEQAAAPFQEDIKKFNDVLTKAGIPPIDLNNPDSNMMPNPNLENEESMKQFLSQSLGIGNKDGKQSTPDKMPSKEELQQFMEIFMKAKQQADSMGDLPNPKNQAEWDFLSESGVSKDFLNQLKSTENEFSQHGMQAELEKFKEGHEGALEMLSTLTNSFGSMSKRSASHRQGQKKEKT